MNRLIALLAALAAIALHRRRLRQQRQRRAPTDRRPRRSDKGRIPQTGQRDLRRRQQGNRSRLRRIRQGNKASAKKRGPSEARVRRSSPKRSSIPGRPERRSTSMRALGAPEGDEGERRRTARQPPKEPLEESRRRPDADRRSRTAKKRSPRSTSEHARPRIRPHRLRRREAKTAEEPLLSRTRRRLHSSPPAAAATQHDRFHRVPTKAEFQQGNAICAAGNKEINAGFEQFFKKTNSAAEPADPGRLRRRGGRSRHPVGQQADRRTPGTLGAPEGEEEKYEAFLEDAEAQLEKGEEDPSLLTDENNDLVRERQQGSQGPRSRQLRRRRRRRLDCDRRTGRLASPPICSGRWT